MNVYLSFRYKIFKIKNSPLTNSMRVERAIVHAVTEATGSLHKTRTVHLNIY